MPKLFAILFLLTTLFQSYLFYDTCSANVFCYSGKCCGPYDDWYGGYTCCPSMSFCGSTVCVSYWVAIVPCVVGGLAIIGGIILIIIIRRRRRMRDNFTQQPIANQQYGQQQQYPQYQQGQQAYY